MYRAYSPVGISIAEANAGDGGDAVAQAKALGNLNAYNFICITLNSAL